MNYRNALAKYKELNDLCLIDRKLRHFIVGGGGLKKRFERRERS